MELETLQKIAEGSIVEQWQTLLSQFQTNQESVAIWDSECKVLFESISEQILHASSLSLQQRQSYFEAINNWGDPRVKGPTQDEYWVEVSVSGASLLVGKHLVTIKEWRNFLGAEYTNDVHWSPEGLNWRDNRRVTWEELAAAPDSQKFICDNQPVVGISWFEAEAYANCYGARLMDFFEREDIVRGIEGRRYPWGREYQHGFANTEEVGLDKSAPVGLFIKDRTPEGVFDMAGNVAEWQGDDMDDQRVMHPGCWAKDSISTWAKASETLSPGARLAYLGFRLVRDL
jgi:formylglycine-generating enzyme required for sulfatase activity